MTLRLPGQFPWRTLNLKVQLTTNESERNVSVYIFDAYIDYGNGEHRVCKAIAINRIDNPRLFNTELIRLRQSYSLNPRRCILGHTCFFIADSDMSYFCYDQYQHDLKSFKESGCNAAQLKLVIRDFVKALSGLHESGSYHGHIKSFNLVIRGGRGFLGGGVGPKVSQCSVIKKTKNHNEEIYIEDPYEHDAVSFAQAIDECIPMAGRDPELSALVEDLIHNKSMNTLMYHPYILKPTKRLEFFVRVHTALLELGKKMGESYIANINARYTKNTMDWVVRMEQLQNETIRKVLNHGPDRYGQSLTEFIRFSRNLYVHAHRDPGVSLITHFNILHSLLNRAYPGYAILVHKMCYGTYWWGVMVFI